MWPGGAAYQKRYTQVAYDLALDMPYVLAKAQDWAASAGTASIGVPSSLYGNFECGVVVTACSGGAAERL